ncbi:MAG: carbon-nitrogen hydrolase family protein [Paraglaciecola sp.]|nr:carbon-nitrogen hydrolase family protein [Paraglaciecola sp.]NCT47511.1 carbon-nitrogen hydrolase family protein [Paraglaciecola sp.]
MANVVALQMTSTPEVQENLKFVEHQLAMLVVDQPTLVVLPECFACFGGTEQSILDIAETAGDGPVQQRLVELSRQYGVWLAAGSFPLRSGKNAKYTASCLLFNDKGEQVCEYQKIHLFDVQVGDNTGMYLESKNTEAGNRLAVLDTPFGRLGLAICYDIRFAAMFQAMSEPLPMDVLALPAAFTYKTGRAHWQTLLACRAIENQCYVVAANQSGTHANNRQTYGHSCIISPWGETLASLPSDLGTVSAALDFQTLMKIRAAMPVSQHNKFRSYLV